MSIPNVISVNIELGTAIGTQKSFGVGLIVGETEIVGGARVSTYTSLTSVAAVYLDTDPEYIAAERYFAQQPAPEKLKIGTKMSGDTSYTDTMNAILAADSEFYAIVATTRVEDDVKKISDWTETKLRLFYTASDEDALINESHTTDTTSVWAKTNNNSRTVVLYSNVADTEYPDAATMGKQLSFEPGSYTLKFKRLAMVTPDTLTDSQKNNIWGKKANTYSTVAGVSIIENGSTNTEWIDVINGADWIKSRIEERIYNRFLKEKKISMTDGGVGVLEGVVNNVLSEAQDRLNILSPDEYNEDDEKIGGYEITTVPMRDVPFADKANREYKYLTFEGYLAGAIHYTKINGTLTY